MSVNVLPYAPENVADIFYNWCMAAQTPGSIMGNGMLQLKAEAFGVFLRYSPSKRKGSFWNIYGYSYDPDGRGPELSLWFSDITLSDFNGKALWQAVLEKFCPHLTLLTLAPVASKTMQLFAVRYPDGKEDSGSVFATQQRICVYPASERVRGRLAPETMPSPLTFADMEGVL